MIKNKLITAALTAAICLVISGCSSNKDLFEPVESPDVDNVFEPLNVWSYSTQGSDDFFSQLTPVVSHSVMYVAGRDGKIYAINVKDGSKRWKIDLSDEDENDNKRSARLSGGVATRGKYIAVGSENGYLYVMNRKDGSIYYKAFVGSEIVTSPVFNASGDKIFVMDSVGRLSAFSLTTKAKIWESGDLSESLHLRSQSKPVAVGDELVVIGTASGRVMMLSQLDGFVLNQVGVGQNNGSSDLDRMSDVSSTPLLIGSEMYTTAYNSGFVRYSLEKQAVTSRLSYHSSKDIAYDDNYFVLTGDNGHVYCVRRSDNVEAWVNTQLGYRNVTAPVIYGNYAVVGDLEGYVYFMNLNDGVIDSKIKVSSSPIYVAPFIVGNCLVVYSSDGSVDLICYDPIDMVQPKKRFTDLEKISGITSALIASKAMTENLGIGTSTREAIEQRREEARKLVAQIQAQERAIEAQIREYQRQKTEYEKRVAEYEKKQREELSGYGLMPSAGVKSEDDEEFIEVE